MLVRHGYGVLLFDRRGEGESDGDYNAFGWDGERDLDAAIAFLASRRDVDRRRIGGIGLSVGGELLLQAAAHSQRLRAVVADGAGIRSIRDHLAVDRRRPIGWISPLLVETLATAVLSDSSPPPALRDLVRRAPRSSSMPVGEPAERTSTPATSWRRGGQSCSGRSPRPATPAGWPRDPPSMSDASSPSSTAT